MSADHQPSDCHDRLGMPAVDVERGKNDLTVRAYVPSLKPEDTHIEVKDRVLTISGKQDPAVPAGDPGARSGFGGAAFVRSVELPAGADIAAITATTKDDFIEVTIPIVAARPGPITITPSAA